ncbi:N-acyl-L-amino acid amidohydrolase [Carbonactinospora thermoautotrophica]|uniref:Amidohydrolase n=1 Tax=Carbonactinospora thermoautotrophica TaxID=1469144 RepID=A0A132NK01_9ACTN|nr:amidohydrolase [Carbonactinospora thermoautotrophica]KWX02475.1 Amidohydrolase [Carbonactinospora thermoautotrophica]KWX03589.1 N-acyl-L-amino acid amidohydrolase [Carbonactinospora thermoautotrophica]KWX10481.1 N-acyl-L-amino acid amidohydrolase [Carbonactinospora thermoautotrophica]
MNERLPEDLRTLVKAYADELVAMRRDIHAHPELGWAEIRTTRIVRERLEAAGLQPRILPGGTGLTCDIGPDGEVTGRILALRADLDALPIPDEKNVPYRSTVPGVAHACGHDVHTVVVLGAGLVLADLAREGRLNRTVRLIFQPAEEIMPGGALDVIRAGELKGVERILALHCDPKVEAGRVALRTGPITAACDRVLIRLAGPGGHTARPHLTADLVYALSKLVTELPAALSRRVDPRAGLSLVWGRIGAGSAANAIPQVGEIEGTLRCLDLAAWHQAPELVEELVQTVARIYGVQAEVQYDRGVPPVVNDADSTALFRAAATAAFGPQAVIGTEQSLGGEDFAWYLESVPGALARLGVRGPGEVGVRDLHQGTFDVDESAIPVGVSLLAAAALLAFD